ncbi:S8 family serine peptidase [Cryptosporangium arvum]|uniref:S8 family serine peptidase n=1 Tax=Cryptosporangium arvum TaxID=80871 RepID=UPI0004BA0935|nr:S8 family serine peptidase [Cryptosporangium arvum]
MRARVLAAVAVLAALVVPGSPAAAADQCAEPGKPLPGVPWPQQRLEPETIWPVAAGSGVRVAVLASGVDGEHPQLRGRVSGGADLLPDDSSPSTDCEGFGTRVAGLIAAAQVPDIGFHGLAPKATIVPYRVSTGEVITPPDDETDRSAGTPGTLADAIRAATEAKPDVLVVPVVTYVDDPDVKSAVAAAVAADVVVVATVGDGPPSPDGPVTPYPAAYEDVLGVGPIDVDGTLGGVTELLGGTGVIDLVAPGDAMLSTQTGGGLAQVDGSAYAAAYVAGTAALVRSRWPSMRAAEVVKRLLATATPMSAGAGHGVVSPTQAVSEIMATGTPVAPPSDLATVPPDAAARAARQRSTAIETATAAGLGVVALLGLGFAIALPLGRRRGWRPGIAPRPEEHPEDDVPEPPRQLFEDRR